MRHDAQQCTSKLTLHGAGVKPGNERPNNAERVKRTENLLVVLRQPRGEIDIEVRSAILSVTCRDVRVRTPPRIEYQHQRLDRYRADQHTRKNKPMLPCGERDQDDARREERPCPCVNQLNGA